MKMVSPIMNIIKDIILSLEKMVSYYNKNNGSDRVLHFHYEMYENERNSVSNIKPPEVGSIWEHHSGIEYEVLVLTNVKSKKHLQYPTTVVYKNIYNGLVYSRPLNKWYTSMTPTIG